MADCENLSGCPFFSYTMGTVPTIAEAWKNKYCRSDNSKCARYIVCKKLGSAAVPLTLFPDDLEKANKLILGA